MKGFLKFSQEDSGCPPSQVPQPLLLSSQLGNLTSVPLVSCPTRCHYWPYWLFVLIISASYQQRDGVQQCTSVRPKQFFSYFLFFCNPSFRSTMRAQTHLIKGRYFRCPRGIIQPAIFGGAPHWGGKFCKRKLITSCHTFVDVVASPSTNPCQSMGGW